MSWGDGAFWGFLGSFWRNTIPIFSSVFSSVLAKIVPFLVPFLVPLLVPFDGESWGFLSHFVDSCRILWNLGKSCRILENIVACRGFFAAMATGHLGLSRGSRGISFYRWRGDHVGALAAGRGVSGRTSTSRRRGWSRRCRCRASWRSIRSGRSTS